MMRLKRYLLHFVILTLLGSFSSCKPEPPEESCFETLALKEVGVSQFNNLLLKKDTLKYYHYVGEELEDTLVFVSSKPIFKDTISYYYSLSEADNCLPNTNKVLETGLTKSYSNISDNNDSIVLTAFGPSNLFYIRTFEYSSVGFLTYSSTGQDRIFDFLDYNIDSLTKFKPVTKWVYLKDGVFDTFVDEEHVNLVRNSLPYVVQYREGEDRHTYILQ
ncbi:hypothetical protein GYB22_00950 [bacterium]|nr:hypothetical protein [bacterium]